MFKEKKGFYYPPKWLLTKISRTSLKKCSGADVCPIYNDEILGKEDPRDLDFSQMVTPSLPYCSKGCYLCIGMNHHFELLLFSAQFHFFPMFISSVWKLGNKSKIARGPPTRNPFCFWTIVNIDTPVTYCTSKRRKHIHPPMRLPRNGFPPRHSSSCQHTPMKLISHLFLPSV